MNHSKRSKVCLFAFPAAPSFFSSINLMKKRGAARQQSMKLIEFVWCWPHGPINFLSSFIQPINSINKINWLMLNGEERGPCSAAIQRKIFFWIAGAAAGKEKKWSPINLSFIYENDNWWVSLFFPLIKLCRSARERELKKDNQSLSLWLAEAPIKWREKRLNCCLSRRALFRQFKNAWLAEEKQGSPLSFNFIPALHLAQREKRAGVSWGAYRASAWVAVCSSSLRSIN